MLRGRRLVSLPSRIAAVAGPLALLLLAVPPAFADDSAVSISGLAYGPSSITVTVGDSVTWTNGDGVPHTVTADDASFGSSSLAPDETFTWTFSAAGTFNYHCLIHSTMSGSVTAQPANTAAPGSDATTPPTSTSPTSPDGGGPTPSWPFVLLAMTGVAAVLLAAIPGVPRRRI